MSTPVARVQEKGQVTIPLEMRKKLNLKRGDLVAFIEIDEGIHISPTELTVPKALDAIGRRLRTRRLSLGKLIEKSRTARGSLIEEMYGVSIPDHS
jgi:AbrB family looped-hinge helix DNA binding protein